MTQFVIGGIIDCPKFTRADYIAQNLVEILPNFRVKVYAKKENTFQVIALSLRFNFNL